MLGSSHTGMVLENMLHTGMFWESVSFATMSNLCPFRIFGIALVCYAVFS